jgi:hypothetical protein
MDIGSYKSTLRLNHKIVLPTAKNALVALFDSGLTKLKILVQFLDLLFASFVFVKTCDCFLHMPALVTLSISFFALRYFYGVIRLAKS